MLLLTVGHVEQSLTLCPCYTAALHAWPVPEVPFASLSPYLWQGRRHGPATPCSSRLWSLSGSVTVLGRGQA